MVIPPPQKKPQKREYKHIPTFLPKLEFELFILPSLKLSRLGRKPQLPFYKIFNYILYWLHTGCQWSSMKRVIDKNQDGKREIHYTNIFRWYKKWCDNGSWNRLFESTVLKLFLSNKLDLSVLHGDGTTTAAKKGGDNIGYSGHKHFKGEKIVAICDRNCNVIAPFVTAPGNKNESPLFPDALFELKRIVKSIGANIAGSTMSLDGVYDSKKNRKLIFNSGMKPNIPENKRNRKKPKPGPARHFNKSIFKERFRTIERVFAWEDKFKRALIRFEHISAHYFGVKLLAYSLINLRHFISV